MRYVCDFPEGPVTDRLLCALRERDAKSITTMIREQKFRIFNNTENVISSKTLLPAHIAEYVKDSGFSLHDIFFGVNAPVHTAYSPDDETVRSFLNSMGECTLQKLFLAIRTLYPNSFYDVAKGSRPSKRLREVFLRLPRGSLSVGHKTYGNEGIRNLSDEAKADIQRYSKHHFSEYFVFDVNCFPEYAEFVGVSLHWLWDLPEPLFCNTQIADLIFDYYTLMQASDKHEFLNYISYLENMTDDHDTGEGE